MAEKEEEIVNGIDIDLTTRADFDSDEEYYFGEFLKELIDYGVILWANKNLLPIQLSSPIKHKFTRVLATKEKEEEQHIHREHVYTPDFNIEFNPKYKDVFYSLFGDGRKFKGQNIPFLTNRHDAPAATIELKGSFIKQDEQRAMSLNLKWVFDKWQLNVQLVKVPNIFKDTFTPQAYMDDMVYKRDNGPRGIKAGDSKLNYKPKTIDEYVEELDAMVVKVAQSKPEEDPQSELL